jgi:hypothetical protein
MCLSGNCDTTSKTCIGSGLAIGEYCYAVMGSTTQCESGLCFNNQCIAPGSLATSSTCVAEAPSMCLSSMCLDACGGWRCIGTASHPAAAGGCCSKVAAEDSRWEWLPEDEIA